MTRARAVLTALVLTSALGLVGCSDDDPEPKLAPPSSEPTPSPSTSAASAPAAPVMPEAAKGTDAAAAEAFVKFYWDTVNYAQETGDVSSLRELATKCVNCDNSVGFIQDVYGKNGSITGGQGTPKNFTTRFTKLQGRSWAVVDCVIAVTPQVLDLPGENRDKRYSGGPQAVRIYLEPVRESWTVRTMDFR